MNDKREVTIDFGDLSKPYTWKDGKPVYMTPEAVASLASLFGGHDCCDEDGYPPHTVTPAPVHPPVPWERWKALQAENERLRALLEAHGVQPNPPR